MRGRVAAEVGRIHLLAGLDDRPTDRAGPGEQVEQAVALAQGNMALAARLLGIGRTTLYARLAGRAATPRHPTRALRRSSHEPGSEGPNESKR